MGQLWFTDSRSSWALYAPTGLLIAAEVAIEEFQTLGSALLVVAGGWIAWTVTREPSSQLGDGAQPRVQ